MSMQHKRIEHVIMSMERQLDYLKRTSAYHEKEVESAEENSFAAGLHKGYLAVSETEIEFLEREIDFLKGAL